MLSFPTQSIVNIMENFCHQTSPKLVDYKGTNVFFPVLKCQANDRKTEKENGKKNKRYVKHA